MDELIQKKKLIIQAFIKLQEESIRNLKSAMDEAQQTANDYGQPKDRYDSFRTQLLRKRDLLAQQAQKAYDDLVLLKKINPADLKQQVGFGAVVITNFQRLLIVTGLGKTIIDGEEYYAISTAVPIYHTLKDLKTGGSAIFNNKEFKILQIF